jgi:hypothetical protein
MQLAQGKRGVSRLAIPAALLVVVALAGAYVILTGSSTTTSSQSSSSSLPNVPLSTVVNKLVKALNDRNIDNVVAFYSPNAVTRWSGNTGGLSGLYTGTNDIRLVYATTVGKSTTLVANVSDYAEHMLSPTRINATFQIGMIANSTAAGEINARINASQAWTWASGGWQISKENWNYVHYDSSLIDAGLPHTATTFPQWSVMKAGGNPDLVSEKSFEWHAGPYIAASVYAFLFGVVAFVALRLRSTERVARR